jgi:hypothetical protein
MERIPRMMTDLIQRVGGSHKERKWTLYGFESGVSQQRNICVGIVERHHQLNKELTNLNAATKGAAAHQHALGTEQTNEDIDDNIHRQTFKQYTNGKTGNSWMNSFTPAKPTLNNR